MHASRSLNILARRSGRGSKLVAHAAEPNVPASRRNRCGRTNTRDLDNKVDPQRLPQLSLRRNTARSHSRAHTLDWQHNSLRSLRRQARRKLTRDGAYRTFLSYTVVFGLIENLRVRFELA